MFYLNSTLNFGIPIVLVFQLEVYYKEDRLLTSLTAQQKGTTARWYSNKTSLSIIYPSLGEVLVGSGPGGDICTIHCLLSNLDQRNIKWWEWV